MIGNQNHVGSIEKTYTTGLVEDLKAFDDIRAGSGLTEDLKGFDEDVTYDRF